MAPGPEAAWPKGSHPTAHVCRTIKSDWGGGRELAVPVLRTAQSCCGSRQPARRRACLPAMCGKRAISLTQREVPVTPTAVSRHLQCWEGVTHGECRATAHGGCHATVHGECRATPRYQYYRMHVATVCVPLLGIQHLTCCEDTLSLKPCEHAEERPIESWPRPGDHSTKDRCTCGQSPTDGQYLTQIHSVLHP